jgi:hypothetical protein
MSANSSVQHLASGIGAYLGGVIVRDAPDHRVLHYGTVGWVAALATLSTLWLAGRVKPYEAGAAEVSAEKISLAAAAEASADDPVLSEATAS